jgi:hypothetical protein
MSGLQDQLDALERGEHDPSLPEYEVERQKKILRNKMLLASLGLDELVHSSPNPHHVASIHDDPETDASTGGETTARRR